MDISSVTQNASTQMAGQNKSIADDFDTFLLLLTTQLQNQDPTSPMDTNQFTSQLVDFASVEQQLKSNTHLESLVNMALAGSTNSVVSYLGQEVTVGGTTAQLTNGEANWRYSLGTDAASTTLTVTNTAGETVLTTAGNTAQGSHEFNWGGRNQGGQLVQDGVYSLTVKAQDIGGNTITSSTTVTGVVNSIELDGASPVLNVGGLRIAPEEVQAISTPPLKPPEPQS